MAVILVRHYVLRLSRSLPSFRWPQKLQRQRRPPSVNDTNGLTYARQRKQRCTPTRPNDTTGILPYIEDNLGSYAVRSHGTEYSAEGNAGEALQRGTVRSDVIRQLDILFVRLHLRRDRGWSRSREVVIRLRTHVGR